MHGGYKECHFAGLCRVAFVYIKEVSDFVECLADIVEDVFCILNAN